jgi:hypothetical protein
MDYMYNTAGIGIAIAPGSATPRHCDTDNDCPSGSRCTDDLTGIGGGNVCYRVDYSREKLLDLNELSLNETLGVGGPTGDTDIVTYCANEVGCTLKGASNGSPIDWNNDGNATETNAQGDIDNDNGTPNTILLTGNDWEIANGVFTNLNFNFQCTTAFAQDLGVGVVGQVQSSITTPELGHRQARELHILYPPAAVSLLFNPSRSNPRLKPPTPGVMQVALLALRRST